MFKKIIISVIIIIILFLGTLITLPFLFKDKIVARVKTEINKNINAKVDFGEFDLTLLRSFPDLTFTINNLIITGVPPFEGDTLAKIKEFEINLNIMSVIKGEQMEIKSILLNQPYLLLKVMKDSKANWDIAKETTTETKPSASSEPSTYKLSLKKLKIKDGNIIYDDASLGFYIRMEGLNHELKGNFSQDLFTLRTQSTIRFLTIIYEGMTYLKNTGADMTADLEMDMKNSKYTFRENNLKVNALEFGLDGFAKMNPNNIEMDIKLNAKQNDFKNFLSLVPSAYTKDFSNVKTSGKMSFNSYVKGVYDDVRKKKPGFGLNLNITNAMFKYPDLPTAVNNINVDLKINNPDGVPDHTVINIPQAHLEFGSEPFDFHLLVKTPVSDADIDAMIKGKVDLANISKSIPMEGVQKLSGVLNADLTAKGKISAIEKQNYNDFNASGQLQLTNMEYTAKDIPSSKIKDMQLTFNPKNVTLKNFDAIAGSSDIQANGTLDNLIAYFFKKDKDGKNEVLVGNFNFSSNKLDCNEWLKNEKPVSNGNNPQASEPLTVFEVPDDIDFTLNAKINQIIYDNMTLLNTGGKVVIKNKNIDFSNLKFFMLDGNVVMNGSYSTADIRKPQVKLAMDIQNMDIQKAFKTFNTVQKLAPVAEYASGKFSTTLNFNSPLQQDMMPDLKSINGKGIISLPDATIKNFPAVTKMAEAIKMDALKQLNINNTKIEFEIKDGRIFIRPFDYTENKIAMNISGSNGMDASLDYVTKLSIPRSVLGSQANSLINNFSSQAKSQGVDLNVAEIINIDVLIGGTVTKPEIKTSLKQVSGNIKDQLLSKAKEEFEKKKAELEAQAKEEIGKAKAEADKMKKEAEDKVNAEKDKLNAEAEKKKKEIEDKAKAEAEKVKKEAADKAKKEAEKNLKNLFKKPK